MILPRILIVTVGVGIISPIMKQNKNAKIIILQIVPIIIIIHPHFLLVLYHIMRYSSIVYLNLIKNKSSVATLLYS